MNQLSEGVSTARDNIAFIGHWMYFPYFYRLNKNYSMTRPHAFIFDLNGTIIDDMGYHAIAWESILNNQLKAGLSWGEVKAQMYGKNEELLVRIFGANKFTKEEMAALSLEKERMYQSEYKPLMKAIEGFEPFVDKALEQGIAMGIGSAAILFNINFILDGLNLRKYFKSIVSADDVLISKPHPETFLKVAEQLGVDPQDCVVFEDAPKGVESAANAGMKCVVITTMHEKKEFDNYQNILFFIEDYTDARLYKELLA